MGDDNNDPEWTLRTQWETLANDVLMLPKDDFLLFKTCGLLRQKNTKHGIRYQFSAEGFKQFTTLHDLQDVMVVCYKKLKGMTTQRPFLRLGRYTGKGEYNVQDQAKLYGGNKRAPRLSKPVLREEFSADYVEVFHSPRTERNPTTKSFKPSNHEGASGEVFDPVTENKLLCEQITELEKKLEDAEARIKQLEELEVPDVSFDNKLRHDVYVHINYFLSTLLTTYVCNNTFCKQDNNFYFNEKTYPVLASLQIKGKKVKGKEDVAKIMIELRRLEKDRQYEDFNPFVFDAGNDAKVKYVSVPRASTQTSFKAA